MKQSTINLFIVAVSMIAGVFIGVFSLKAKYAQPKQIIDMPEEPVSKGSVLQVENVSDDTIHLGYYHTTEYLK